MSFFCHAARILLAVCSLASIALGDEVTERKDVSGTEIQKYVEQLTSEQQIITQLKVRKAKGEILFDVTSAKNADERAWWVQINVSDADFKATSQKYAADNYEMTVHEVVTANRRKYHSAVWVQSAAAKDVLVLPVGEIPESGETGRELQPLNQLMQQTLRENIIPGATLAVAYKGEMIFHRGFGYCDIEQSAAMSPDSTMRIASLSKPITAVAILILTEQGRIELDKPVLEYLGMHPSFQSMTKGALEVDPRWGQITVRHLLEHSGGWDRDTSKDPMFQLVKITQSLKLNHLARIPEVVQFQLGRPLDFDPGTKYVYCNLGYCLLGRVIEAVTGQSYEAFVAAQILKPAGMNQTRLAKTRLTDRADDEVRYYSQRVKKYPAIWDLTGRSNGQFEMVEASYGHWDIEVMDSHGGWTSTAADLVRFISAIDSPSSPLLQPESRRIMLQPPSHADSSGVDVWYGLGWNVRLMGSDHRFNSWHTGALAGTSSLMVHRWDGFAWAVLFNVDVTKSEKRCADIVDGPLHRAVNLSVKRATEQ